MVEMKACNHNPRWRCNACKRRPDAGRSLDEYGQLSDPAGETIYTLELSNDVDVEICRTCATIIKSMLDGGMARFRYVDTEALSR